MRTFAAVNVTSKQYIASRILLAVFLPILLYSSIHVHTIHDTSAVECADCFIHHCQGHIAQNDATFDACVLCQFLTLTYAAATFVVITTIFNIVRVYPASQPCATYSAFRSAIVTRGPPSV